MSAKRKQDWLARAEASLWRAMGEIEQAKKHADRAGVELRINNMQHEVDLARRSMLTAAAEAAENRCRDCADLGPVCPNTGKPCGATP